MMVTTPLKNFNWCSKPKCFASRFSSKSLTASKLNSKRGMKENKRHVQPSKNGKLNERAKPSSAVKITSRWNKGAKLKKNRAASQWTSGTSSTRIAILPNRWDQVATICPEWSLLCWHARQTCREAGQRAAPTPHSTTFDFKDKTKKDKNPIRLIKN